MSQFVFHRPNPLWFPEELRACTLVSDLNHRPVPAKMDWKPDRLSIEVLEESAGRVQAMVPVGDGSAVLLATPWLFPKWNGYRLEIELLRGLISRIRTGIELWRANKISLPTDTHQRLAACTREFIQYWRAEDFDEVAAAALETLQRLLQLATEISRRLVDQQGKSPLANLDTPETGPSGQAMHLGLRVALQEDGESGGGLTAWEALEEAGKSRAIDWVNIRPIPICQTSTGDDSAGQRTDLVCVIEKLRQARKQVVLGPFFDVGRDSLPDGQLGPGGEHLRHQLAARLQKELPQVAAETGLLHVMGGINGIGVNGLTPTLQSDLMIDALETAATIAPYTPLMVSFDQPCCERHAWSVGGQTPDFFLTKLLKQRTPLHAIGLEWNLGYFPRGTLPRMDLDWVMQLHHWAIWEIPVHMILRIPATPESADRSKRLPAVAGHCQATHWDQIAHLVEFFSALPWIHSVILPGLFDPDERFPEGLNEATRRQSWKENLFS